MPLNPTYRTRHAAARTRHALSCSAGLFNPELSAVHHEIETSAAQQPANADQSTAAESDTSCAGAQRNSNDRRDSSAAATPKLHCVHCGARRVRLPSPHASPAKIQTGKKPKGPVPAYDPGMHKRLPALSQIPNARTHTDTDSGCESEFRVSSSNFYPKFHTRCDTRRLPPSAPKNERMHS